MLNAKEQSLTNKIARNTSYNMGGRFFNIVTGIIMTPYIMHYVGVERYGIWAIVGVVTGYFGLFDFGVGMSFVKYIAEFNAKKDYRKLNEIINSGFIFYSVFAAIIALFASLYLHSILSFLKIPPHLYDEAVFAFFVGVLIFCASSSISIFTAIQNGLQRIDIANKLGFMMAVPSITGTVLFLRAGYGLRGLIINNAIVFIIAAVFNIAIAFKILPQLRVSPFLFSWKTFKQLFGFGTKLQVTRIVAMIVINIEKLFIARFVSIGMVTFYQLGSSVIDSIKSLVVSFTAVLVPAFSEIDARGERKRLVEAYARGTKYLGLITIPIFFFVIISAPQIMKVWMGLGYDRSVWVIRLLGIGWLWAILSGVRAVVVQAIAKPEIEMKVGFLTASVHLPLSLMLIIRFGFLGAALGAAIAILLGSYYAFRQLHRELDIPLGPFLAKTLLKTFIICLAIGLPSWGLMYIFQDSLLGLSRVSGFAVLAAETLLFFVCYMGLLLYVKPLDESDGDIFSAKAPFLKYFTGKK